MRYGLIYADPSWQYRNVKTGGSHISGSAQKYPVMALHEIASMPVRDIAAKDCVLALWGTTPLGKDPYEVLAAWGFTYKTELYWHKVGRKGTGYWLRGDVEKLLIGTRGKVPAWRHNLSNWVEVDQPTLQAAARVSDQLHWLADGGHTDLVDDLSEVLHSFDLSGLAVKPTGHSHKPETVRALLTQLTPDVPRVELFATDRAEGFDSFGLELDPSHDFRDQSFWDRLTAKVAAGV